MQVPTEAFNNLMSVVAGILKVGNITFATAGGAQVSDKSGKEILFFMHIYDLILYPYKCNGYIFIINYDTCFMVFLYST